MLRYERKYLVSTLLPQEVALIVKLNPGGFSDSYAERWINSVYFDSLNWTNVADNLDGFADRTKVRIRWYGPTRGEIAEPVLEVKRKRGLVGWKDRYALPAMCFDGGATRVDLQEMIRGIQGSEHIATKLACLSPVIMIRYKRRYFQDRTGMMRVTIDRMMSYESLATRWGMAAAKDVDTNGVIIELKYPPGCEARAEQASNKFPFRVTRNSKYIAGLRRLGLRC